MSILFPPVAPVQPALAQSARAQKLKRAMSAAMVRNPLINGFYAGATVTSIVVANADATLTNKYQYYTASGVTGRSGAFALSGGSPSQFNGTGAYVMFPSSALIPGNNGNLAGALAAGGTGNPGWSFNGWTWTAEFESDAPSLEIHYLSANGNLLSLQIDGQFVTSSAMAPAAAGQAEQIIRVAHSGGRRWRRYVFRGRGVTGFRGVFVDPQSRVSAPPTAASEIVFEAYGTSITEGAAINVTTGNQDPDQPFMHQLAHQLGWRNVTCRGSGSCGYIANSGGTRYTARQQLALWNTVPDVYLFNAAYNDVGASAGGDNPIATIVAEALLTWQTARAKTPNALILVTGIEGGSRGPTQVQIDCETAMAAAFAAWADPFSGFIRISTDFEPWFFGTGNYSTNTANGNAGLYMNSDVIHPIDIGHNYFAARMIGASRSIIASL